MERYAWKATVLPGKLEEYIDRHNHLWPEMKAVLKDIQSGKFARDFILEARANYPMFMATRRNEANHQLEQVGKELRGMMTWLKKDKKD